MLKQGQLVTVLDDFAPPPVDGFFLFYGLHRSYPAGAQHQDGITMSAAPIPSQAKIARAEKPFLMALRYRWGAALPYKCGSSPIPASQLPV